jgi:hypothetical protein
MSRLVPWAPGVGFETSRQPLENRKIGTDLLGHWVGGEAKFRSMTSQRQKGKSSAHASQLPKALL